MKATQAMRLSAMIMVLAGSVTADGQRSPRGRITLKIAPEPHKAILKAAGNVSF